MFCFVELWIDRSGAVSKRASVDVDGNDWLVWKPEAGLLVDCWEKENFSELSLKIPRILTHLS